MGIPPAILTLALGQTLVWAGLFYVFPAMLLHWEAGLGWSRSALSFGITLAVLASAVAAPTAGRLIDQGFGPPMIGVSCALGGFALMLLGFASALWQFYLVWLVIGIMLAGCLYEPCFAMVTRAHGAQARRGITTITLFAGFAGTLSFPTIHWLVAGYGWRGTLVIVGAGVACIVAPLLWRGAVMLGEGASTDAPKPKGALTRNRVFWLLGLGFATLGLVHGAMLHHLLPLLGERDVPKGIAVAAVSAIGPMQVAGRVLMVATEQRVSAHGYVLAVFTALGLALAVLALGPEGIWTVAFFVAVFGASYGMISILRPVVTRQVLGEANFGATSGALAMMYLTASALSAYVGALIWRVGGYGAMMAVLGAVLALGFALYRAARRLPG